MAELYYSDDRIQLYHGRCEDVLPTLAAGSVDLVLTDPPYDQATHIGACRPPAGTRTGGKKKWKSGGNTPQQMIHFEAVTFRAYRAYMEACGRVARRWVVTFGDWRHVARLERRVPNGLRFVRFGIWIKPNGMPQFTGDRPAQGFEAIGMMHRAEGRMSWNGGGAPAIYQINKISAASERAGDHPTAKPRPLIAKLIEQFSSPGDLILDPFCGSGVVLHQAKRLGRRAIGIEMDERWCWDAAQSLTQDVMNLAEVAA